jgi:2-keto-4-pentenoate hydratase/2-oxohepta-3-ene-1,7-dioic acid hydratase in catechol pathway
VKLVTLGPTRTARLGAVLGADIVDLSKTEKLGAAFKLPPFRSVAEVLEQAALPMVERAVKALQDGGEAMRSRLRELGALMTLKDASLLAPFPKPGIIYSVGGNYKSHIAEVNRKTGANFQLTNPIGFIKNSNAVIGPGAPIVLPKKHPNMVDFEAEFSFVIGKPCHDASESEAMSYVAGFTIINDVSARDFNAAAKRPDGSVDFMMPIAGKQFPTFCPMGPSFATVDEIADRDAIDMRLTLNGETMQQADTSDLMFKMEQLLSYFSQFYRFEPGDVISTGTPGGVGFARNPPRFLRPGDVLEITATAVGTLVTPVIAAPA